MSFSEEFMKDPRVRQGKELLLAALHDAKARITKIQPAKEEKKATYEQLVKSFSQNRGLDLVYPYIGSGFGNGALVELLDGSVKYDFITGIGVHYFGHSAEKIVESSLDAAISDTIMQGNLQQNKDSMELADLLVKASGLPHCLFTTSGAMANENAMKMLFQKKTPAQRILAFERCFMGRSLTLSQVTDKPGYREGLPLNQPVDYVPFFDPASPEESIQRATSVLKKHISRYPEAHALMAFELVQGEAGSYPGSRAFFIALMDILRQHKIPIFIDEVQTFGRTSRLFAFQHFGLENYADVVSIGKLSQVCATLYKTECKPRPNLISQTFTSGTSAIRASLVVIKTLLEGGYFGENGKIETTHRHFEEKLAFLAKKYPEKIEGPFGIGAMVACTVFKGDPAKTKEFLKKLFELGLIGFLAGGNPTRTRFLVPMMAITPHDIDEACRIIEEGLQCIS